MQVFSETYSFFANSYIGTMWASSPTDSIGHYLFPHPSACSAATFPKGEGFLFFPLANWKRIVILYCISLK